jgi:diketogulonate reductase-like aldo/keto reductase
MAAKSTTGPFGTTRRQVACVGQGTWKIEASAAAGAIAALRRGLDLGLTTLRRLMPHSRSGEHLEDCR